MQRAQDFAVSFPEREGRDLPAAAVATQVRGSCPWLGAALGGWGGASPTPGCPTQVGACLLHRGPPVGKNDQLRFLYLFDSNAKHASWYVDLILFLPVNPYQNLVAVCWFLESYWKGEWGVGRLLLGGAAREPRLCPREGSELGRGQPEAAFCEAVLKLK